MKCMVLKTLLLILCSGLLTMAAVAPVPAENGRKDARFFIGFWEGVDLLDGSTVQISISDIDHDGVLDVRYRESQFTFCIDTYLATNTEGHGIYSGTATVSDPGVITIDGGIVCIDDDNTHQTQIDQVFTARADRVNDTLTFQADNSPDPIIILHRTSK